MANWKNSYKKAIQKALSAYNGYAPALALIDIYEAYNVSNGDMILHVYVRQAYYIVTLYNDGLYGTDVHHIK